MLWQTVFWLWYMHHKRFFYRHNCTRSARNSFKILVEIKHVKTLLKDSDYHKSKWLYLYMVYCAKLWAEISQPAARLFYSWWTAISFPNVLFSTIASSLALTLSRSPAKWAQIASFPEIQRLDREAESLLPHSAKIKLV